MVIAPVRRNVHIPPVEWRSPTPMWLVDTTDDDTNFYRPTLLRFTTDSFMDDFIAMTQTKPDRMSEWCARKETWRLPAPVPELGGNPLPFASCEETDASLPEELQDIDLKLFQPAHERYYLVTASLVCRMHGLPDKFLDNRERESVSFVLRRLMRREADEDTVPDETTYEHAFVDGMWSEVPAGEEYTLFPNEEEYSLFPTTYFDKIDNMPRRLFAGLIPVSNREKLLTAGRVQKTETTIEPDSPAAQTQREKERRFQLEKVFEATVRAPWQAVIDSRNAIESDIQKRLSDYKSIDPYTGQIIYSLNDLNATQREDLRQTVEKARDRLQVSSWYVLLDFAYYLRDYLPALWSYIYNDPDGPIQNTVHGYQLWQKLQELTFIFETNTATNNSISIYWNMLQGKATEDSTDPDDNPVSMAQTLHDVYENRVTLENMTRDYSFSPSGSGWLTTEFLLCGLDAEEKIEEIQKLLKEAIALTVSEPIQRIAQTPLAARIAENTNNTDYNDDLFVVRCVFKRPCWREPLNYVVSEPTREFRMASYFDPDAPTRPIRIPMPIDTSPAGLRKFAKNTMFVLSDTLACQVDAARSLTFGDLVLSVLPWPLHKDLPDVRTDECKSGSTGIGKLCTLSIPIVTICALILLIIMVQLLDIIFKWVPYLIFCLPIPGLKAKENQ